jgi:soluble P-type ATPase
MAYDERNPPGIPEQRTTMRLDIPGWGAIDIRNIVTDLNGTLAVDGKIPAEVRQKIAALSKSVKIYVLSADTQGSAEQELSGMEVEFVKVPGEESNGAKSKFLKTLDLETTVAIGNGSNDQLILKEAALGIAVLGGEGISVSALKNADVVVKDVQDAFDLLLKPKRLIATLRE